MHLQHLLITATFYAQIYSLPTFHNTDSDSTAQIPILAPKGDNLTLTPIRDALVSNKVIGDVLDDFEPSYYLDVVYPKDGVHVYLGNEITPSEIKKRPRINILKVAGKHHPKRDEETTFTVILTDPDATSRYDPKWSEMCHWIVTNITVTTHGSGNGDGNDGIELDLEEDFAFPFIPEEDSWFNKYKSKPSQCKRGDGKGSRCLPGELESYFAPAPPAGTGWHRYVFVLLAGDAKKVHAPKHRKHWGYGAPRRGVRDWAKEYGLEVVSANFFFAENEQQ